MSISRALHRLPSIFKHNPSVFVMENHQMSRLLVVLTTVSKEGDVDSFRELLQVTHLSQDAHAAVTPSPGHIPCSKMLISAVAAQCSLIRNFITDNCVSKIKSKVRNMSH